MQHRELISQRNHVSTLLKATVVYASTVFSWTHVLGMTRGILGVSGQSTVSASYTPSAMTPSSTIVPVSPQSAVLGLEFRVNTWTSDDQINPAIADFISGDFLVVWDSKRVAGNYYGVSAQRYTENGTMVGTEIQIDTYTNLYPTVPGVFDWIDGNYAVHWRYFNGGPTYTRIQRFFANGSNLGQPFFITLYSGFVLPDKILTRINKEILLTYCSYTTTTQNTVNYQRYLENGTTLGSAVLVNTWTTGITDYSTFTMLPNDDFVVVWQSGCSPEPCLGQDTSNYGIFGRRYSSNGTAVSQEFQVNTWVSNNQKLPAIATANNGNFMVVWQSNLQDGSGYGIYGQLFSVNGTRLGTEFRVNTWTVGDQQKPVIHSLTQGGFVVAWVSYQDGFGTPTISDGIYGQLYGTDGRVRSPEFHINTFITDSQQNPSITALMRGGFVVVWQSYLQDGSLNGIYGQRYAVPFLSRKTITLQENQTIVITATEINATAAGVSNPESALVYTVGSIQNGRFEWSNNPGNSIISFTQQDINQGSIRFVHDGGEIAPWFELTVSLNPFFDGPYNASIFFTNVNDAPILLRNQLLISQGQMLVLSSNNLLATDVDSAASQLQFMISNLQHGRFTLVTDINTSIVSFTQGEISSGLVQFIHDRSTSAPSYQVAVNDGILSSGSFAANITFILVNQPPILVNYHFSIKIGERILINSSELYAYDIDSNNATLNFRISNLQNGYFEFGSNPSVSITLFAQQQVTSGNVWFVHDGSDKTPTASVQVIDDLGEASGIQNMLIAFESNGTNSNISNTDTDNSGIIAGAVVASTIGVAALIAGGFWYRQRVLDTKTRKQHQFADFIREALKLKGVNNFNSERGQRYLNLIRKFENTFSGKGGMTLNAMGEKELKQLAMQVATSARNKITPNTSCGYSIIKLEDIDDQKISDIVQDVLQMRVGNDDMNISMAAL